MIIMNTDRLQEARDELMQKGESLDIRLKYKLHKSIDKIDAIIAKLKNF